MPIYSISQLSRGNGSWSNSRIDRLFLATVECDSSPVTASLVYHDVSFEVYYLCYLLLLLTLSASSRWLFERRRDSFHPVQLSSSAYIQPLSHFKLRVMPVEQESDGPGFKHVRLTSFFLISLRVSRSTQTHSTISTPFLCRQPFVRFIV